MWNKGGKSPPLWIGEIDLDIRNEDLTFDNLSWRFGTGRAYVISGTGRDRVMGYRTGVQTKLGDIELGEWMDLMQKLIDLAGEQKLHADLVEWETEHNYCKAKKAEIAQRAMELHSNRIFDNPAWVDFIRFNTRYRPSALEGVETLTVFMSCCKQWGTVTKAQTENYRQSERYVCCPICGRFAHYDYGEDPVEKENEKEESDEKRLPTAEQIGAAATAAVRCVSQTMLTHDLKYRILDFCYPGPDGTIRNQAAQNTVQYLPYMQDDKAVRVQLSYKCPKVGKKLRAFMKQNGSALVADKWEQTHNGVMFYFSLKDLLG